MKTWLKLFFKWGIQFEEAYSIEEKSERKVQYADCREVEAAVLDKYPPKVAECVPVEFVDEYGDNTGDLSSQRRVIKTRNKKGNS